MSNSHSRSLIFLPLRVHTWLRRPWFFDLGARLYGWFTQNEIWYTSCAHLTDFFPAPRDGEKLRVLELGAGPGITAIQIKKARADTFVIGLDLAPRMLDEARDQITRTNFAGQILLVRADADALPFANDSLDVVAAHSFLYLVSQRENVLREAARVLRAGGIYVSMEPRDGEMTEGVYRHSWRNWKYAVSIIPWRIYSAAHGRLTEERFCELFARVGLQARKSEVVLDGLGIIGRAEKI